MVEPIKTSDTGMKKWLLTVLVFMIPVFIFGENYASLWKKVKDAVDEKSMEAGQNSNYDKTRENVMECWITLVKMGLLMAILSVIALEFIDKDKR